MAVWWQLRAALNGTNYGATMMKIGWHARLWDRSHGGSDFMVLDVAQLVGEGVGSGGVARYYALLACHDAEHDEDADGVILDIKFEPPPAAFPVLDRYEAAWYTKAFPNHAARSALAQRALTSFTDPFVGWTRVGESDFVVRQRSPWKASFDSSGLRTYASFAEYVSQLGVLTATSHARGSIGKPPGTFKEIASSVLGPSSARASWSMAVALLAAEYREQVQLDYGCFSEYYEATYGALSL